LQNESHAEAFCNRPHEVYGFNLRPFCLYYLHLLQSIDSPLLTSDKPFTPAQLLQASEICSSSWSPEGYTLDRILRPSFAMMQRNRLRLLTESFLSQRDRWIAYYGDTLVQAQKWEDSGETYDDFGHMVSKKKVFGRTDLDRVLSTATVIFAATGWAEKDVMMMPIGKALAYADYFAIHQGAPIQFFTAREQVQLEAARKKQAEQKKQEQNGQPAAQ
jgi:hypothetical protein